MDAKLTIHRASWTLIDQGVVSFGNFLLNVLLARTLVEEEYGEFALFLGAIFILRNVDYSFISYPLSVRLCHASDEERARLLGNTILLATALALVLVVFMALGTTLLQVDNIVLPACPLLSLLAGARDFAAIPARRFPLSRGGGRRCHRLCRAGPAGRAPGLADAVTLPKTALYIMSVTFGIGAIVHASKLRVAWPDLAEARLWRVNIWIGKWSLINYWLVLPAFNCFHGCWRPLQAPRPPHRFRPG